MKSAQQYADVIQLLIRASEFSKHFCGGCSSQFHTTGEFRDALNESISLLSQGDTSQFRRLYQWFLPTSCWADVIGPDGYLIGELIRERIDAIMQRDFSKKNWNVSMN